MKYRVEIKILPKEEIVDPQGNVVRDAVRQYFKLPADRVGVGKYISYDTTKGTEEEARSEFKDFIKKFLVSRGLVEFNTENCDIHKITRLDDLSD